MTPPEAHRAVPRAIWTPPSRRRITVITRVLCLAILLALLVLLRGPGPEPRALYPAIAPAGQA